MKHGKTTIVVTYGLLLYFFCFVVPPVSSILPSADTASFADTKSIAAIRKDTTRERMYLFDLTLWEILKRTKRSDNVTAVLPQRNEDHQQHVVHEIGIVASDRGMLSLLTTVPCREPNAKVRHRAGFSFAYPGLSPPSPA